ncbi:MAG TPA: TRL domain-containing protein [Nitrospirota bacterium]|nr:TRL domain-containing protein [Nitrospirota bacterium]
MKPVLTYIVLALVAISLAGCLYTNVIVPYGTELNKTELGHKKGTASTYSVVWLFAWGDAGAAAAAKNGGITTLTHMDRELHAVLFGIYTRQTTIVYGD